MFGTVYRLQTKPGKKEEAKRSMMLEDRRINGAVAFYLFDTSGDELWGTAVFEDEKTYRANANDPEQDKWYGKLREFLVADPEWHDGNIQAWPGNCS